MKKTLTKYAKQFTLPTLIACALALLLIGAIPLREASKPANVGGWIAGNTPIVDKGHATIPSAAADSQLTQTRAAAVVARKSARKGQSGVRAEAECAEPPRNVPA